MIQTLASSVSSKSVNIYITHWVMRCDMFQFLHSPNTNCGYWEMPPLLQQGRRVNKDLHGITSHQRKGGNLAQWRSSRQDLIAKSTCEAEVIASSEALQQGENIATVVAEMINESCDIEVSSNNASGSETAWRTRHISVKALWLRQMARRGVKFT